MAKFPLRGFLIQAPQALYSWTGYGAVLGGIEGFKTDILWSLIRGNHTGKLRVVGPPPSDILGKATRYLLQPAYHYWTGDGLSYQDHWLLSAADALAMSVVQQSLPLGDLDERWALARDTPIIEFDAWHPATLEVAADVGYNPEIFSGSPIAELGVAPTYDETLSLIAGNFERWSARAAVDFPKSTDASFLQILIADAGRDALNYFCDGDAGYSDAFSPEELAFARMFEMGLVPEPDLPGEGIEMIVERSLELAQAAGKELPGYGEIAEATGRPLQPG